MISCISEIEACVVPRNELDFETVSDNYRRPNKPQIECRQTISSKLIGAAERGRRWMDFSLARHLIPHVFTGTLNPPWLCRRYIMAIQSADDRHR